jgi:hypothetical protein
LSSGYERWTSVTAPAPQAARRSGA